MKYLSSVLTLFLNGLLVTACTSNDGQKNTPAFELTRSATPSVTTPSISDAEYATFIADANDFGLGLYQQMNGDLGLATQNGVFSPASAQLALAMTYGAAAGDTAAAMKSTLRDTLGADKYHAGCNRLQRDLASRNASGTNWLGFSWRVELSPANSLWVDRKVVLKTPYLDLLSAQYDTGLWRADFENQPEPSRLSINQWVMDHTHNRIENLLQKDDVDNTLRFVLVNALYFYGSWFTPFAPASTQPAAFQTLAGTNVNPSTMHSQMTPAKYKPVDNIEVLQLAYGSGDLWMTLVLPATGQFETTRAQVSGQWLANTTAGLTDVAAQISLPKFKVTTAQLKLKSSLTALGMGITFSKDTADFTGMTDEKPLYIYDVAQKASIEIDENGTAAAAATAVLGGYGSSPPRVAVTFDRPFLFFVQDKTGLVLFAGQVVDPTQ